LLAWFGKQSRLRFTATADALPPVAPFRPDVRQAEQFLL